MKMNVLYVSAHASLMKILGDLSTCEDSQVSNRASVAMKFADELKKLYVQSAGDEFAQPSRLDSHPESDRISLMKRYSLLMELGMPINALVSFARSEGLHEIDVIRIIRGLKDLDFAEAKALLEQLEKK